MIRCLGLALFCVAPLLTSARAEEIASSEETALLSLASELEAARLVGDVEAIKRLTLADALSISESGGDPTHILADVEATARHLSEGKVSNPSTFVAERDVQIHSGGAVVTELVRVTGNRPQPPIRRSLFWVRDGESWKLAHMHASPYLRWESSIAAFEAADQQDQPRAGGVVFIGSSSIRRWESLANDFEGFPVLNRGFGGSQMIDSVLFAKRIVTPYSPAAVAIYEGDNDIGKGKSAERVFADFQSFVDSIQDELPETHVAFIAIKPSLKRWAQWPEIRRANQLIEEFAATHSHVDYLDIATPMLGEDGTPRDELFVSDGLHLTEQGYAIWADVIRPWVASFDYN